MSDGSGRGGPAPTAQAVIDHVVRSLVDDDDAVEVTPTSRRRTLTFEVRVADGELGRVIGRKGRTAQNIRALARAAAAVDGVEVDVDFVD